jgi:hypothetical protein
MNQQQEENSKKLQESVDFLNESTSKLMKAISNGKVMIGTGNVDVDTDLRDLVSSAEKGSSVEEIKRMSNLIIKRHGQRSSNS